MFRVHAGVVDYAILAVYFAVVLGIGQAPGPHRPRLLPVRPLAAGLDHRAGVHRRHLGALEILGLAANGAKYGAATVHFYWIGAIPAMVFLGIVMMPFSGTPCCSGSWP